MVFCQRLLRLHGVVPLAHDGVGPCKEHREPRHGEFLATISDEVLTPQVDPILYVGLQKS